MNNQPVLSAEGQMVSKALQQAVANALDKKWRLGQYAVISVDNQPVIIEGEALKAMAGKALNVTKQQEKSLNNGT
ncbi:MAG: hypothetical protein H6996_01035 [Moraxellaceae bacterium]|nr:hypothetical protein [Pseudomonadales bacterium]MCB1674461.1 hypothetical protein [Pseudomonadales bacterium]MCP5173671.1 hypothetical protein [Moraxellaceae bacterium]MCP5178052.1 hypothetical protein [Moraxellaceae bacterium]HQV21872.1 hypothetical protein [Agitococcus sp.]